jgi:hypothetical protein
MENVCDFVTIDWTGVVIVEKYFVNSWITKECLVRFFDGCFVVALFLTFSKISRVNLGLKSY